MRFRCGPTSVSVSYLARACVQGHSHSDRGYARVPFLDLEGALRREDRIQRLGSKCEARAESIAHSPEHNPTSGFNRAL